MWGDTRHPGGEGGHLVSPALRPPGMREEGGPALTAPLPPPGPRSASPTSLPSRRNVRRLECPNPRAPAGLAAPPAPLFTRSPISAPSARHLPGRGPREAAVFVPITGAGAGPGSPPAPRGDRCRRGRGSGSLLLGASVLHLRNGDKKGKAPRRPRPAEPSEGAWPCAPWHRFMMVVFIRFHGHHLTWLSPSSHHTGGQEAGWEVTQPVRVVRLTSPTAGAQSQTLGLSTRLAAGCAGHVQRGLGTAHWPRARHRQPGAPGGPRAQTANSAPRLPQGPHGGGAYFIFIY